VLSGFAALGTAENTSPYKEIVMRIYMHMSVNYPNWLPPLRDEHGIYVEIPSVEILQQFLRRFDDGYLFWHPLDERFIFIEQYEG